LNFVTTNESMATPLLQLCNKNMSSQRSRHIPSVDSPSTACSQNPTWEHQDIRRL
jgi:hypothetical protein